MQAATSGGKHQSDLTSWLIRYRSHLLLAALVVHKCTTDGLTRWTRLQTSYSSSTVAVMCEVVKYPLIATAIATYGGGRREIITVFKQAFQRNPFANTWIALCYTFNNLLYYDALSALSAVAYQVLSQSKTVFTAGLMYVIGGKKLLFRQVVAVGMLIGGALLVQLQEISRVASSTATAGSAAAPSSAVLWGSVLVLFSSFISALPNVKYEKVLKTEGENQWVNNVQVTTWIILWVSLSSLFSFIKVYMRGGVTASIPSVSSIMLSISGAFSGFTLPVWGVVFLKAINGILIPATFKYADNIVYSYAKPSSIVLTTLSASLLSLSLPAPSLLLGVALVVASIFLYSSQPKAKPS